MEIRKREGGGGEEVDFGSAWLILSKNDHGQTQRCMVESSVEDGIDVRYWPT